MGSSLSVLTKNEGPALKKHMASGGFEEVVTKTMYFSIVYGLIMNIHSIEAYINGWYVVLH